MRQLYNLFYKDRGIRQSDQLVNLRLFQLTDFPLNSVFHSVPSIQTGPDVDPLLPYFQGYQKRILLENVADYVEPEGPVRKPAFNLNVLTMAFRQKNKEHWLIEENPVSSEKNPNVLIVENYGYLDSIYKYSPMQMTPYYQWLNRQRTVWNNVNEIAKKSDRNQFLFYPVPNLLQGKTILDQFAIKPASTQMVGIFGQAGDAGYMQLDLWRWINPATRRYSLISRVDPQNYNNVNLIITSQLGKQILINLGYLNSWIKGQQNTTPVSTVIQFTPEQMQKINLKLSMSLNSTTEDGDVEAFLESQVSGVAPGLEKPTTKETEEADFIKPREGATAPNEDPIDSDFMERNEEPEESVGLSEVKKDTSTPAKLKTADEIEAGSSLLSNAAVKSDIFKTALADIDKDIEALDRVNLSQLKASGKATAEDDSVPDEVIDVQVLKERAYGSPAPEDKLKQMLNRDAESNMITAADYRKMEKMIDEFQNSADPYGKFKTRKEASIIKPEELVVTKEEAALVTSDSVPDKTMAAATLSVIDKKYIRNTLHKDILKAVESFQNVGVIVKSHEVEVKHSVLGSYEHHVLEFRPIDGAPSSIKFTLPTVSDDGTFMAGSNKYIMRAQRVD